MREMTWYFLVDCVVLEQKGISRTWLVYLMVWSFIFILSFARPFVRKHFRSLNIHVLHSAHAYVHASTSRLIFVVYYPFHFCTARPVSVSYAHKIKHSQRFHWFFLNWGFGVHSLVSKNQSVSIQVLMFKLVFNGMENFGLTGIDAVTEVYFFCSL